MRYFITLLVLALSANAHGQQASGKESAGMNSFHKPEYPGGEKELHQYLSLHLHYPSEAIAQRVEGEVWVNFVIGEDGMIKDIKTVKKLGYGCEEEAERVVRSMPRWRPATRNGRPISIHYKLPVVFELSANTVK